MEDFADAVAVVTGAASGIGLALSEELTRRGARVVLADIDGASAHDRAAALGRSHVGVELEVADPDAFARLADRVGDELGGATILVNRPTAGRPGLSLTAYTAEPATASADKLALLAGWAATPLSGIEDATTAGSSNSEA